MKFFQCIMNRNNGEAKESLTSWIPEKYAKKGSVLELMNRNTKEWTNGWIVKSVGFVTREKEEVVQRSQDCKRQRMASDI